MKPFRILYIDVPFENEPGGDKNRSRFLWNSLSKLFKTDLVLIGREGTSPRPLWTHHKPLATLTPQTPPFPRSACTPAFSKTDQETFRKLLDQGGYDAVLSRFCTSWELCELAERTHPKMAVIVDVDMLSSRLVALSWKRQPSIRRRWFLFEKWRLQWFERRLFRKPWLFFFTNPTELGVAQAQAASPQPAGIFATLPNTMPFDSEISPEEPKPVILFFGSMDSAANTDGFAFLMDDVLPHLDSDLARHRVSIHVVGKNPPSAFQDRVRQSGTDRVNIIGGVDSIASALDESLFVLLPLRIASGTRTRILEAAARRRGVVTTSLGAEGLDLGDTVLVSDSGPGLAAHCKRLLGNPEETQAYGQRLWERARASYAPESVADNLAVKIRSFIKQRQPSDP